MGFLMRLQIEVGEEHAGTVRTCKSPYSLMHFQVFIQICFLSKTKLATFMVTLVRSLISMNSKMIKEIVPFPEMFSTFIVVTLQNFDLSLRLRILESVNPELLCIWHVLPDVHCTQIECLSSLHLYLHIGWYILKCVTIMNVFNECLVFTFDFLVHIYFIVTLEQRFLAILILLDEALRHSLPCEFSRQLEFRDAVR